MHKKTDFNPLFSFPIPQHIYAHDKPEELYDYIQLQDV